MIRRVGIVVLTIGIDLRCAGLGIPQHELGEILSRCLGHAGDEILDGHCLAIEALEVKITAAAEGLPPHQVAQHAHHFRTLLIDGQRVEVGDLDIVLGANRVSRRPTILGELRRA